MAYHFALFAWTTYTLTYKLFAIYLSLFINGDLFLFSGLSPVNNNNVTLCDLCGELSNRTGRKIVHIAQSCPFEQYSAYRLFEGQESIILLNYKEHEVLKQVESRRVLNVPGEDDSRLLLSVPKGNIRIFTFNPQLPIYSLLLPYVPLM